MDQEKLLKSIIRQDLPSFIHKVNSTINPGIEFLPNWHIDLIAEYLEAVKSGQIKRLIINMPPRALKSVCINVAWPAWILGKDPTARIISASYSQALSTKHSLDTRFIVSSGWYKNLFPKTKLSKKQNQKSKFMTTKHGFRFSTSVGGTITGEGGDFLILDDPHNPVNINSPGARSKVINWFEQTFSTRLNDRKKGAIVLVMQRLHDNDLSGHLLKNHNNEWEHLKIPTLAHERKIFSFNNFSHIMEDGDVLHKKRDSLETIERLVSEIGSVNFAAQFQQEPMADNSGIISKDSICFYEKMPENFSSIIQSWDTAIKGHPDADYSVCTTYGLHNEKYYLIDFFQARLEFPDLKKSCIQLMEKHNPSFIIIEDKSSGQSLIQEMRALGHSNIMASRPTNDKITRLASSMELLTSGKILFPNFYSWSQIVINQLLSFPAVKNDDIVDSISQFMCFIKHKIINFKPKIRQL